MSDVGPILQALYERRFDAAERLRAQAERLTAFEAAALGVEPEADHDVNARSSDGFTVLHLAAFFGHGALVRRLLARGADPTLTAENPIGVQPLHSAVAAGDEVGVRALLEAGADPDAAQNAGITALHAAAMTGNVAIADALLDAGADVTLADDEGTTPAAYARRGGHDELARRLGG